jgi:kumamolisin
MHALWKSCDCRRIAKLGDTDMTMKPYFKLPHDVASTHAWSVPTVCALYNWPTGLPGRGKIGIVELGGGWMHQDMVAFFSRIHQTPPKITDVSIDGTQNSPGGDADAEVALDIQIAGAGFHEATGQPADITVLWAQDIATAVLRAVDLGIDVISISWGAREMTWGRTGARAMEQAAIVATNAGCVVLAASGDNNSGDGGPGANVDLPAGCPHVIGCGGTRLTRSTETVWNDGPSEGTGGGFSTFFPMPSWQIGAPNGPGRMVPDVAGNADPNTGYHIIIDGQDIVVGGTSAMAPLYASLIAGCGTKLGFIAPKLWATPAAFRDITVGDNGQFRAGVGPDPCTGLGSPHAARIAALLA